MGVLAEYDGEPDLLDTLLGHAPVFPISFSDVTDVMFIMLQALAAIQQADIPLVGHVKF